MGEAGRTTVVATEERKYEVSCSFIHSTVMMVRSKGHLFTHNSRF
jgi:hypothetical protein